MKKLLMFIFSLTLVFSLSACGTDEVDTPTDTDTTDTDSTVDTNTNPVETKKELVELEYWHHMEGSSLLALESAVDEFNKTIGFEEGIFVTPTFKGWNTTAALQTLAIAGDFKSFPDVVQLASFGVPIIAEYDITVPVEDMYAKTSSADLLYSRSDILPNAARTFTFLGDQVGMPFSNSALLLYINKDMWTAAGLGEYPTTIAELSDAAAALTKSSGGEVTTFGLEGAVDRYLLVNWLGGMGSFIGDNEGGRADYITEYVIDSDGSFNTFMNEWESLLNAVGDGYQNLDKTINEDFATGRTAMAMMSSARIGKVLAYESDIDWVTVPFPGVNDTATLGTAVGGSSNIMFDHNDDAKVDASWTFVQWMSGVEAQRIFCSISGYIPVNLGTYDDAEWMSFSNEHPEFDAAISSLVNSDPQVQEPFDMDLFGISGVIESTMNQWKAGEITKTEAYSTIMDGINGKIQDYIDANY